jgi:hypothetical protein
MIQRWHFNCTCALCSSTEATAASDQRKLRIQGILDEMGIEANCTPEFVEKLTKELMDLLETERLTAHTGDFASILAGVHMKMNDLDNTRKYARLSVEKQTHYKGYDSEESRNARENLEFVEGLELQYS